MILRRALAGEVLLTDENQLRLAFVETDAPAKVYEYAVLVTDTAYDTLAIAQLYRDRMVCVVRKDHPVIREHITLEQFMQHSHARLEVAPHGMSGRVIDEAVARAGGKLHIAMLAQNYGAVLNTVAQSNLFAMVSERMLKSSRNPLALQILEPPLKLPDMRMNLFWHERTHKDPRHRWFRQLITTVAREL